MIFIYNALSNGWTVRKINDNKYEFSIKKKNNQKKDSKIIDIETQSVSDFINMNIKWNIKWFDIDIIDKDEWQRWMNIKWFDIEIIDKDEWT